MFRMRYLRLAGSFFLVYFALMLAYRYYDAEVVRQAPFEFDLFQNLAIPAFAALVSYVTAVFGRR